MGGLLPIAEAQRLILERARPLGREAVPIERAAGRVLAEPAVARVDLPPFPSSAMDGFAVRAADTAAAPVALPVVARIAAGRPAERALGSGEAMAISTGGVVPEGADAVVPIELVETTADEVRIGESTREGANVRRRGGDVQAGDTFLAPGARLGAAQVGALAAAGLAEVRCTRRPRAAILVTGSELRPPGEELEPGEIYESNSLVLTAGLESAGAVCAEVAVVADDARDLRRAIERALADADLLVTSGGASVGPHDLVRATQSELGVEEVFWGVSIKPGKPLAFGVRGSRLAFGVPGNPVSALVTFEVFVRPAINALLGLRDPLPAYERGVLAAPIGRNPRRDEFVRATKRREGDTLLLEPVAGQESHMVVRAAQADALVALEAGEGELREGDEVRFLALS